MKNLNKVLAMLVVFMMMISTVAFAASSFTDVADTSSYSTAIEVGVDLGLIKGYTDGTFAPEGEITRAEFAAIVVRLLGQETQAEGAKAATQFVDVPADHWAAGYVNIAVQAGVINGYGDGNFGPEDLVEYQDAITMMVRALGYEPAIGSAGYPTGYLTKAGDLGLTKNVNGTNGVAINRGAVAQIAFNALDVPLMTQSGYGTFTQYVINDGYSSTNGTTNVKKTLLSENHDTVKVQGVILSSTDSTSTSTTGTDKVTVSVTNYLYNKFGVGVNANGNLTSEVMEVGTSDALQYVGKKCVIFVEYDEFEDQCTVKALYEVTSSDSVVINLADVEKYTSPVASKSNSNGTNGAVETEDFDYSIDADATVYYNGIEMSKVTSTFAKSATFDKYLPKKDGSIELALLDSSNTSADYDTVYITAYDVVVVDEVRASASRVVAKATSDKSDLSRIEYDESDGDVKATLVDANGNVMDWADLEENTVLGVKYVKAAKEIIEAQVINNVVTGTVTEVDESSNWATTPNDPSAYKYVTIDDVDYEVLACAESDDEIEVGDEGTYYLGLTGIVWHDATVTVNTNYAYVVSAQNESATTMTDAKMKLVTKDGTATYLVDSKIYVTDMNINNNSKYEKSSSKLSVVDAKDFDLTDLVGSLITIKTDASGTITAIELPLNAVNGANGSYDYEKYFTIHQNGGNLTGYDPDDMSFTGGLTLTDNTVIFDVTDSDNTNWEVVALNNLVEDDQLGGVKVYNVDDDDYIGAIVVTDANATQISGSTNAATFVTAATEADDEDGVRVTVVKGYNNGEFVTYETDDVSLTTAQSYVGKLVVPEYKANGDVKKFNVVDGTYTKGSKGASNYAVGISGTPDSQDSSKNRIVVTGKKANASITSETIKVPTSANVYVYEASSTKRTKYTTDAYLGYVEYDDNGTWGWYINKDKTNLNVTVYMYEYDGDIVDVVYYVN